MTKGKTLNPISETRTLRAPGRSLGPPGWTVRPGRLDLDHPCKSKRKCGLYAQMSNEDHSCTAPLMFSTSHERCDAEQSKQGRRNGRLLTANSHSCAEQSEDRRIPCALRRSPCSTGLGAIAPPSHTESIGIHRVRSGASSMVPRWHFGSTQRVSLVSLKTVIFFACLSAVARAPPPTENTLLLFAG